MIPSSSAAAASFRLSFNNSTSSARGPFRDLTGVSNSNLKLVFEDAVKQSGVHYQSVSNLITHAGSLVQSVIGKSETDSAKRTENPASGELSQASVENHAEVLLNSRAEGGIPLNEKIVNALKSLPTGEQFVVHKATTAKDALFNEIKESPSTFILSEKTLAKFKSLVENNSGMGNSKALKSVEDFMTIRHEIKSRLSPDDSKTLTELNKVTRSFISSIVKNGVGVNSPAAGSSKHADALNKHKQICSKLIALDKQSSALSYNVEIANRIGESLIKAGLTQDECAEVMASANNLFRDSIEENDSILSTINRSNHLSSFEQTQTRLGQESITFDLLKNALADIAKPKADDAADSGPGPEVKVEPSKDPGVHVTINAPFNFTYHEGNKGSESPGTASESQPASMTTPDATHTDDPIAPQLAAVGVGTLPEEMDLPAHPLQNPQRRAMANVSDSSLQHTPDHSEQESQTTSAVESPRQSVSRDSGDIGDVGNELRHDVIDSATGPAVESMRQDEQNTVSTDRTDQASGTDGNPTLVRSPVSSYIGGPGSSSARTNPAEARRTAQSGVRVLNSQGTQFQGMNGGQTSGTPASMGTSGVSQGVGTRTAPGVASVGTGTHNPERTSSRGTGSGQVRGVAEDTVPSASPTSSYIGGPGSSSARTNPAEARRTAQSGARVLNSQGTQFQGMNGSQTTGTPASTGTSRSSEGVGLNTAPGSLQGVGINTAPGTSQNGASNTAAGGTSRGTGTEDLSQSPGRGQARGVMEETVPSASPASSYIGGPGSSGARANPAEARRTAQGAPGALNSQGTPFQGMNGGQTTGTPASTGTSRLSQGVGINTAPGSSQSGGSNTAAGGTSRGTGTEDLSQGPDRGQARGVMEETVPSASPASSYIGGPGSSGARANPAEARRTAQGGPGALNSQGTQFQGMNGGQTTGTPASTGTSGASQRAGITTTPGSSQGVGINTAVGSSQSGGSNTAAGGTSRGTGTEDLSQGPDRGQARGVMEETVPSASPASSYIGGPGSSGARANPAEARRTALGGPGALNSQGTPFQGMNGGQTTGTPALTGTSRLSQGVGINTAPGSSQGVGINTTPGSSQNGGSNTAAGGTSRGTGTEDLSQSPGRGQARGVMEETVPSASPASSYIGGPGSSGARANPAEARRTAQGGPGALNSQGTQFQGMNGGQTTGTPASTSTSRSSQGVGINTAPGGTSRSTGSENPERTSSPGVDNGQARGVTGGAAPSASPASSYIGGPGSSGARANPAEARRTAQGGPGALNSQGTPFQRMNGGQKTGTPASIGTTDLSQSVGNNTPSVSSQSGGSNTTAGGASRRTGTQNPERTSSPGVDNGRARGVTGGAASSASPASSYIGGPGSSGARANPAEARRTAQEGPGALNSQGTPFQGMKGGQTTGTPASTGTTDSSQGAGINTAVGSSQSGGSNTAAGGTSRGTGTEDLSQGPDRGQARGVMEETVPSASPASSYIGGPGSSGARANPAEARRTALGGPGALNSQGTPFQGMNGGQKTGTPASTGTTDSSQGVGNNTPSVSSQSGGSNTATGGTPRGTGTEDLSQGPDRGQARGVMEETVPSASPASSYIGGPGSSGARANPAEARRTAQGGPGALNSQGTPFQVMNSGQTTGTPASTSTSRSSEGVGINTAPGSSQGAGINTAPGSSQSGGSNTAAGVTSRGTGTEDLSQSPDRGQARGVKEETVPSASPASSYIGGPGSSGARANPAEARRTAQGGPGILNSQGTPFQGMNGGQTTGTPASTSTSRSSQGVGINTAPGGTSRSTGSENPERTSSPGVDNGQARGVTGGAAPSASPASSYIGGPGSSGARANPAEARRTAQGGPGALNSQGTPFQGMNGGQKTGTPASIGTTDLSQSVGNNTPSVSSQSGGSNTTAGGASRRTGTQNPERTSSPGVDNGRARGVTGGAASSASPASSYIGGPGSSGARANPAEARRTAQEGPGALNSQGTPFQGMKGGQTTGTPASTGTTDSSQGVGLNTTPGSSQGAGINTTPGSSQNGGSNTAAGGTSRGTGTEDLSQSPGRGQARGVMEETVPSASPASSYIGGPGSSGARANPAEARRTAQGGPGALNSQGTPFQGMNGGQTTGTPALTGTSRLSQGVGINMAPGSSQNGGSNTAAGGTSRGTGTEDLSQSPDRGQARGVTGGATPSTSPASSYIGGPGSSGARANPAEARRTAQGGTGGLNSQGTPFQGMNGDQTTGTPALTGTSRLSQGVGNNTPSVSSQSGGSNTTAGGASRRTGTQNPERTSSPGVDNGRARGVTGGAASSASPASSYIGGPGSSGARANPAEARRTAQEGPGALNSQGTPFQGMKGGQTTGTPASTGTTDSSQGVGLNTTPGSSQGAGINTTPGSSQNGGSNTAAGGTSRGTGTEDLSQSPGRGQARGVMEETVPSASPASSYIGGPGSSGARANPAEARRTVQGGPGALNSQGTPFQGMNGGQTTGTPALTGTSRLSQGVGINMAPGSSQNGGSNTAAGGTSRGTGTEDLSQSPDRGQARGVTGGATPSTSPASSYIGGPGSSGARANPAEARRTAQGGTGGLNSQGTPFQGMNGDQTTGTPALTGTSRLSQGVGINTAPGSSQSGGSNTAAGGISRGTGTEDLSQSSDRGQARGVMEETVPSASPASSYIGGPGSSGARANPAEARRTAQKGTGALNSQGTPFQGMNGVHTTGTPAFTSASRSSQGIGINTTPGSSQSGGSNTVAGGTSRATGTEGPSQGSVGGQARGVTGSAMRSATPASSYIGGPGSSGARANPAEAQRMSQRSPGALNSQGTLFQGMNGGRPSGTPVSAGTSGASQRVGTHTAPVGKTAQNRENASSRGTDSKQARDVTARAAPSVSSGSPFIGGPGSSSARANPAQSRLTAQSGPGALNSQGTPFQGMNGGRIAGAALRGNSTQTAATKSPRTAPDGSETMNDLSLQRGIAGEQTRGVTTNSAPSATTRSSSIGGAGSSIDPANPTEVRRSNQDVPGQLNRQGTYWQGLDGKQASKMTPEKMNNSSSFIGSRGSSQAMPNFNGVSKTTVKK